MFATSGRMARSSSSTRFAVFSVIVHHPPESSLSCVDRSLAQAGPRVDAALVTIPAALGPHSGPYGPVGSAVRTSDLAVSPVVGTMTKAGRGYATVNPSRPAWASRGDAGRQALSVGRRRSNGRRRLS